MEGRELEVEALAELLQETRERERHYKTWWHLELRLEKRGYMKLVMS